MERALDVLATKRVWQMKSQWCHYWCFERWDYVAEGYNAPISLCDPTAMQKFQAIRMACQKMKNYRLLVHFINVTLEAMFLCVQEPNDHARIDRVCLLQRWNLKVCCWKSGRFWAPFSYPKVNVESGRMRKGIYSTDAILPNIAWAEKESLKKAKKRDLAVYSLFVWKSWLCWPLPFAHWFKNTATNFPKNYKWGNTQHLKLCMSAALSRFAKAKLLANMQSSVATVTVSNAQFLILWSWLIIKTLTVNRTTVFTTFCLRSKSPKVSSSDQSVFSGSSFRKRFRPLGHRKSNRYSS